MNDRMQTISAKELDTIHNASMQILKRVGVAFHEPQAVDIFKKHGVKTESDVVFLQERDVEQALASTPSQFTIAARNSAFDVVVGGDHPVFAPGYGAAFLISSTGEQHPAAMKDYDDCCRLMQTSPYVDMNGFLMVTPWDVAETTAHLHMLKSNMTLCDKAFIGCSTSRQAAVDALEMAAIIWGGKQGAARKPVMISLISAISPLIYTQEMTGALIELAKGGQALIMTGGPKAGSTGPLSLAGVLALQNAQLLAGITLAQLVNPGTPITYGGICGPMDLQTGIIPDGAPELSKMTAAISQLADYYHIPSRSGGALTDAHVPDIQAGVESTFGLTTAAKCGVHLIVHACGMLSSFMGFCFEKFLVDEALCGMIRNLLTPIPVTMEAIDLKTIEEVGVGGEYLTHPSTLEGCRTEFFLTDLMNRQAYDPWSTSGKKRLEETASERLQQRLSSYKKPAIDPDIEKDLSAYVSKREKR